MQSRVLVAGDHLDDDTYSRPAPSYDAISTADQEDADRNVHVGVSSGLGSGRRWNGPTSTVTAALRFALFSVRPVA